MKYRIRCHCGTLMEVRECVVCPDCAKIFAASRKGYTGDGTGAFYPRKHRHDGKVCEGSYKKTNRVLTLCKEIMS